MHYQQQVKHAQFPSENFRNEARLQYNRGFVLVCCRSHQTMGLGEGSGQERRAEAVVTGKNAAVPHCTCLEPAKSAGWASPIVPTDLDAPFSVCLMEGDGLTASRKVLLSPASFSRIQPVPRVLRASDVARHWGTASITRSPNICEFTSAWLSASANSPHKGGNYCLNSGIS